MSESRLSRAPRFLCALVVVLLLAACTVALPAQAHAATTWLVAPVLGPGIYSTSIQAAVDHAASGDEIWVATGSYQETITIDTKVLSLIGAGAAETTINAGGLSEAVTIRSLMSSPSGSTSVTVSGFTITGGKSVGAGGGVMCDTGAIAVIEKCRIVGNSAGGGVTAPQGGGGIGSRQSTVSVTNCVIAGNSIKNGNNPDLSPSNLPCAGAGILSVISTMTVTNCTIADNTSSGSGREGISAFPAGSVEVANCIIANHTVGTSGCSSDYNFFYNAPTSDNPGAHSIQGVDPLFVDAANRDYRLTSDSQARDAGLATVAPGTDLLGVARPQGSGVDMGAYEFQTDLYVSIEGSNTAGDGSEAAPYRTVPYAIDKSGLGGTVFVGPGNFTSATDGEIVMKDGVSLVGEGSDETTLTGSATAVIRAIDISEDTTISGFAITGGVGVQFSTPGNVWRDGGGVYCSSSSALSIADCVVTGNDAVIGGGIYCDKSSPTITSCSITGNWGRIGSGVYCGGLSPTITNCVVAGNDGSGEGGAIACGASSPTITNCTVADNTAWNNAFSLAGGISSGDGSSPTITNCVVWGNDGSNLVGCTATYSDIGTASVEPGFHNISADPSFVSTRTGDYRLKWGSKCIDAGTNTAASVPASAKDKDGVARPQGGSWDMGAYEFVFPTPVRLHYAAGAGGSIVGSATQVVDYGASGSSVTASPSANYRFVKWSDESTQNPRTDTNVTADVNVIATFTPAAPNLTTVWRFRSATMVGSYLWTPDPTEAASIKANLPTTWIYEGAAFTINRDNPLNSNQMYRFRNKLDWTYFYTADLAEKANLENNLSATWELEGPAWKVSLTETPMPVWRFRCLKNSTHFWTSDPNEKLTIENTLKGTYQLEGVAYYLGQ